ncbi:MAG: TRAP transporter large permease [Alphaproteobacteria bacterium]|nr:TRAP transporter large permease [Alphaproteobacteria bacterium]
MTSILFFWIFIGAMAIGIPIVFALAIAPTIGFLIAEKPIFLKMIVQRTFAGIDQFPLLAIPFFILAGEIMNKGGITVDLVRFANALVGHWRGGLGHVNIVASMLFAGISGSAVADTSAIGSILIPAMERDGYSLRYSAAVTAASSVIGPIIPPSIIMVVYAFMMNVSVAGLFAAGIVPGILVGIVLMIVNGVISRRRGYQKAARRASVGEMLQAAWRALVPLMTPVIIIGGILGGIFTPTEAAGIAAAYALFVSMVISRTLRFSDLPAAFLHAAISSAAILLVVGTATAFAFIATLSQIPTTLSNLLFGISDNPYAILFIINVFLLIVGMFLDAGPAILILGPILAPTMIKLGMDPLHFAIVMCVNMTIGLATPPMGLILFVASSLTRLSVEAIAREMIPFLAVEVLVIFFITYFPIFPMLIPWLLGYVAEMPDVFFFVHPPG